VPPVVLAVKDVVDPIHTVAVPEMVVVPGDVLTVTTCENAAEPQLFEIVYDIAAVPAATPLTTPDELTVAIPVLLLLHVPPVTASVNVVVDPVHIMSVPLMIPGKGNGLTVMTWVAATVVQLFVTV